MSEILLYLKDYASEGRDRYFLAAEDSMAEVSALDVAERRTLLVCHDYWLIAPSIQKQAGALPRNVVDVEEFRISISGSRKLRGNREKQNIAHSISDTLSEDYSLEDYLEIYYGRASFDFDRYRDAATVVRAHWLRLVEKADAEGELQRHQEVEFPVFNYLWSSMAGGVRISKSTLVAHKRDLDHNYYMALKNFASKHKLPFEVPTDQAVIEHLEPLGFNFEEESVDYVLNFIPAADGFTEDCLMLRKLSGSRRILSALPGSTDRVFPIIDMFGTITSRIYLKDPALQSLSRRYRNVIAPDDGKVFSYVDYDQFEVGIMAALSGDEELLRLYGESDIYEYISKEIFKDHDQRKFSKKLFLSFTYGMKFEAIIDAAAAQGADRKQAKEFFRRFKTLQKWKESVQEEFERNGRISTANGNHLKRESKGRLTEKERRSCVSQVVQGTASLIFKKALLSIAGIDGVEVKLTLHDAALIQHLPGFDTAILINRFSESLTNHFSGAIKGKASIESFYEP